MEGCVLHIKARHSATKQHGGSLPGNVTARAGGQSRGRSTTAKHLSSTDSVGPAQTEMIPIRVDPRESMHMARQFISKAETCQQSFRGAVLVPNTYGWDTLAATVVRRSQTAHCSHLRSRVSVGLEAPKIKVISAGSRAGRRAEQTFGSNVPDPP